MYITNQEIYQCQKLLHPDYHQFKVEIKHSRILFFIWALIDGMSISSIKEYLKGEAVGFYSIDADRIYIFPFAFRDKEKEFRKQEIIHCLYHELRHNYQWAFKPKLVRQRKGLNVNEDGYDSDPTERDANRFASRMCMKYRKEISEILNVEPTWIVMG